MITVDIIQRKTRRRSSLQNFLDSRKRYEVKQKFAFLPKVGTNGKRIWFRRYVRRRTLIWGLAGEGSVIKNQQNFLPAEYTLWLLKNS